MNNSINSISNINFTSFRALKKQNIKADSVYQTSPQKVSFKGTEALAAYNYNLINTDELSDLPILKPLDIPLDLDKVQGEKVYTSDGRLVGINANYGNKKVLYHIFLDNEISYITADEKDGQARWVMDFTDDKKINSVRKLFRNGKEYVTYYNDDGEVSDTEKIYQTKDGELEFLYSPKRKEYNIGQWNYDETSVNASFDENKMCKSIYQRNYNDSKYIYMNKGVPYAIETSHTDYLNPIGKEDIDLTNLEPHPNYTFDLIEVKALKGKKTYYSDGKLESITTEDGKKYEFDLNGNLECIHDKSKSIFFRYKDGTDRLLYSSITEEMSDGATKTTMYYNRDNSYTIKYENDNIKRKVGYYKNGNMESYTKTIGDEEVIYRYYDKDGNLTRCEDK